MAKISIVIPVYNEVATLEELVRRVKAVALPGHEREIILVDDGSNDGSRDLLVAFAPCTEQTREIDVRVFFQGRNRGKGAALRRGFSEARGEIILIQDADLEYDPADYPALLAPLLDERADVVYGSRFVGGKPHRVLYFWHAVGNKFLTACSNAFTNLNLTDMECCYKVFRREILQQIDLKENRFGIEPEVTAKVAKLGCRIFEVGVSYAGRTYEEGKKIGWRDGFRALWCIVRYNLLR